MLPEPRCIRKSRSAPCMQIPSPYDLFQWCLVAIFYGAEGIWSDCQLWGKYDWLRLSSLLPFLSFPRCGENYIQSSKGQFKTDQY